MALGGNLTGDHGSSEALLEAALLAFPPAGLTVLAKSRWWRSVAWPDPSQPAYTNGVVLVETAHAPEATLRTLLEVEQRFGRRRQGQNAARTLDLDLIAHGRTIAVGAPDLPHPRAHERLFVMGPLAEIAPGWRHPVTGERAEALARQASVGLDAAPL